MCVQVWFDSSVEVSNKRLITHCFSTDTFQHLKIAQDPFNRPGRLSFKSWAKVPLELSSCQQWLTGVMSMPLRCYVSNSRTGEHVRGTSLEYVEILKLPMCSKISENSSWRTLVHIAEWSWCSSFLGSNLSTQSANCEHLRWTVVQTNSKWTSARSRLFGYLRLDCVRSLSLISS